MKHLPATLALIALIAGTTPLALAQEVNSLAEIKPVPILTGYTGFVTTFNSGEQKLVPQINPILLVPIKRRWLLEAEFELEGEFEREDSLWEGEFETEIEYLQLDFLAHRNLTVVLGRYLTPFGIFNERLHPLWIKKLQPNPIIFPLGTGSSNGLMLRGGSRLASGVNLNYAGYFSALTTVNHIEANRTVGGRWGFFLPNRRLEIGTSFQRVYQDERFNVFGFDGTWQPKGLRLDVRGEYARSKQGSGYWVEGAYRFLRQAEAVVRVEQFFAPLKPHEDEREIHEPGGMHVEEEQPHHGVLPEVNKQRLLVGWNYYFRDGLRSSFSYGRDFGPEGKRNIWSLGIAYRF